MSAGSTLTSSTSHEATADSQSKWIQQATEVCQAASKGDLEARLLHIDVDGDLGRLLHSINHMLDVNDAFVRESVASLDCASRDQFYRRVLERGMQGIYRHAAQGINKATSAMHERSDALKIAEDRRATLGAEITNFRTVCEDLANASSSMRDVVRIISTVARQTNLISLNAAVEAARIGDAGRAFAIVADEIKSLSQQTSGATEEIQGIVEQICEATVRAVHAIDNL
ncbi:MAG: hypothetical protein DHS20C16_24010 [Phycisphaerae bacterium]|nr:MAG: hypothetical protein DHS20C16_24010 [Phycisphaerae bacterium]